MRKKQKNLKIIWMSTRGITLVALVITIIILIILAGVTLNSVLNDGIIKQAKTTKEVTNNATEKEMVSLAVTSARMNDKFQITEENLRKELDSSFGIGNYKLNEISNGWELVITKSGNQYEIADNEFKELKKWYYTEDGNSITNGEQTLGLGDIVKYDPTKDSNGDTVDKEWISYKTKNGYDDQTFKATSYIGDWGVLGVDDNGNVLIMPTSTISSTNGKFYLAYNASKDTTEDLKIESCKNATQYALEEFEEISNIYGYGKGAIDARCLTIKDVDKYTKFDPTGCFAGKPYEYGNKVVYSCEKIGFVTYSWMSGEKEIKGTVELPFNYLEDGEWKTLKEGDVLNYTSGLYSYSVSSGTASYENCYKINNGKLWKLFFTESASKYYYLGTQMILTENGGLSWPIATIYNNQIGQSYLYYSDNSLFTRDYAGIRPVITLGKYVNFGGDADNGWTIE